MHTWCSVNCIDLPIEASVFLRPQRMSFAETLQIDTPLFIMKHTVTVVKHISEGTSDMTYFGLLVMVTNAGIMGFGNPHETSVNIGKHWKLSKTVRCLPEIVGCTPFAVVFLTTASGTQPAFSKRLPNF